MPSAPSATSAVAARAAPVTPAASTAPAKQTRGAALWINLAIIYVVWGSTYFGIAIAIETMPPFLMSAIRFAVAGSILVALDLLRNPAARRLPTRRELRDTFIVGALLLGIGNGFVTFGEQTVPSGVAAILIAMIPLWFAVFGWLYFRQKLPRIVAGAVVLGFAGTALLVAPAGDGANRFDPLGILILLIAPIGWSHGSLYSANKAKLPPSPWTASGLQMLAGASVTLTEAFLTGEPSRFHPESISTASILGVAYLVIFGSMVAFTAYAWLLKHAPLSLVGTYAYINPIVAVSLGALFLHESLSVRTLIASGIIIAAVAIIVTARSRLGSREPDGIDAIEPAEAADAAEPADAVEPVDAASDAATPRHAAPAAPAGRPAIPPRAPSG
jgi:drug/metabolite transporter (DMT)-like permease